MKIIALNGSCRKNGNTAQLLDNLLKGAEAEGMQTKLVHLYAIEYSGCVSCFSCKLTGGPSHGRCAVKDALSPVLEEIRQADALVLGSPVYWGSESGKMRSCMERLWFQSMIYSSPPRSLRERKIPTALIYTMNVDKQIAVTYEYDKHFAKSRNIMERIIGPCEVLCSYDTLQFCDYSKYETALFDVEAKKRRNSEIFPQDLEKAFNLGKKLANKACKFEV